MMRVVCVVFIEVYVEDALIVVDDLLAQNVAVGAALVAMDVRCCRDFGQ